MALHTDFPKSPYSILDPELRWFPADEAMSESSYEKLLPHLVHELRNKVNTWRNSGYKGAADSSIALLDWWFKHDAQGTWDVPWKSLCPVSREYYNRIYNLEQLST